MWQPFGERGWRLWMKCKNASVVGLVLAVVLAVGLELRMEQAKRSHRTRRHGAGEGGRSLSSATYTAAYRGGRCLWLGLGPGQEALQGGAGGTQTPKHLDHLATKLPTYLCREAGTYELWCALDVGHGRLQHTSLLHLPYLLLGSRMGQNRVRTTIHPDNIGLHVQDKNKAPRLQAGGAWLPWA